MKRTLSLLVLSVAINFLGFMPNGQAQTAKNKYSCINEGGIPRTVVDTKRGKIEMIVWKSKYFGPEWPAERRCQEVTERFQEFSDAGNLRYVTTGKMNSYNVICVGDKRVSGYECRKNGLLITLQPNDSPTAVMNELFNINNRISGGGLERGGAIDLISFLKTAPLMETAAISSPQPISSPKPVDPPSEPDSSDGMAVPDLFQ
ncbi:hypothetical protein C7H19_22380 [Aphanothece hegewaldii CCALA 016]|uniref:Uncharacterized protein n=1 Tax=Aphanothece hegewaldii CCALA 016 TaxID=2107694 RepID=A0A2T1LRT1_9CHRO|nr:COP23 domain-containing protein [Aphanothece hegewaldii]PSF31688.1 hypothetical protein C7H19_22380 [Aphanothece hegewaldii CCALA 016]